MMGSFMNKERFWKLIGGILIFVSWQSLSLKYNSVIVPSPYETYKALVNIIVSGEAVENLKLTFFRQLMGLSFGVLIGSITGIVAGLFKKIEWIIQPLILLLLSVPAIIFVTMSMVWFGIGTKMVVFLISLLVFPVMHTNMATGIKSIDLHLKEMAHIYRLPRLQKLYKIYLPGMRGHMITGFSLALFSSMRLTIMSEMLGAVDGMGQRISISRAYLETDRLFAWIIILLTILLFLEFVIVRPLKKWTRTDGV